MRTSLVGALAACFTLSCGSTSVPESHAAGGAQSSSQSGGAGNSGPIGAGGSSAAKGGGGNGGDSSARGGREAGGAGATDGGRAGADGGATNGGATNGGATNGGATNGGAMNGGAMNGGRGGATNGGAMNGGRGGATNGGAMDGGRGGNSAGGASRGGTNANGGATTNTPSYPFIFSNFNDASSLSSLMIYTSNDALEFTLLYDTKYTGPSGFMRDPSIMRHTDGKYYVAFTTPPTLSCCGSEQSFAIGSSSNLKDWTTVAEVPCGVAGTVNTWAPEWFIDTDGSVHVIVTLDSKSYRYEPTDAALSKWGPGTFIGISGSIDTQIVKIGGTYHAIIPSRHLTASRLDGPWTLEGALPSCKEAPAVVHISGDSWRFYCDNGSAGHEKTSLSTDVFRTWSPLQTLPRVGNDISHGTVIRDDTGHPF